MSVDRAKISMSKVMENCFFILKYTIRLAPAYNIFYIITRSFLQAAQSVISVVMMKYLIDSVTTDMNFNNAVKTIILLCSLLGLTIIFSIILEKVNEVKSIEIISKIQGEILKKASEIDLICYDNTEFYDEFIRALDRGENQITQSIYIIINIISGTVSIISIVAVIMTIDPAIALFPFIACIINLVTILWIKSTVYKMSLEIDPVIRKRNYSRRVFYQSDYAKEIKLTNIKQSLLKQFFESIEEERSIAKKHGLKIVLVKLSNYVVGWTICVYCLPPLYMVYNTIVTKRISQSNMATTYNANTNVFYNLNDMSNRIMELQSIGLFAESFKHFMNYEVKIENLSGDGIESDEPKLIEIKNLSFKYNEKGSNIINNINMKIRPNEKIAIVGHNGAGKSTFIKLLLHLYEASEGEIYYNGKNIKEYDVHEYRKIFGTIFQNSEVYAGTVAENVLMDYVTKENIHLVDDALGYGLIKNKIQSLEYGINTQLTREFDDDGIILSGGEKQKIAISRLFTKKFPVTILDEPSSALDAFAEFELNNNMMSVTKDSTVIFISHRLSTTRMADRIYMFENGKIIEEGSHDELMQLDGEYAKMFRVQSMYYEV